MADLDAEGNGVCPRHCCSAHSRYAVVVTVAQSATAESPVIVRTPPPSLSHRICPCQQKLERQQTRCGTWCGSGGSRPLASTPPQDMCIVCHELAVTKVPCPHCGKPANL